jgi:hypothetical protein
MFNATTRLNLQLLPLPLALLPQPQPHPGPLLQQLPQLVRLPLQPLLLVPHQQVVAISTCTAGNITGQDSKNN